MLYQINNQTFLNFDQHVDINSLNALKEEICYAFTLGWLAADSAGSNPIQVAVAGQASNWPNNTLNKNEIFLPTHPGHELFDAITNALNNKNAPGHSNVVKLANKGFRVYANLFLKLIGENLGIGHNLSLRYSTAGGKYSNKHISKDHINAPAAKHFTMFFNWLNAQNIFSEYGRAIVFFNDQDQHCLVHRDHSEVNPVDTPDEFIWVNLFTDRKKFYVLDGETGEKVYAPGQVVWFDTANWHGSNTSPYAAFSIRVDGVFSDEWRRKIIQ